MDSISPLKLLSVTKHSIEKKKAELKQNPGKRERFIRKCIGKEVSKVVTVILINYISTDPIYREKFKSVIGGLIDKTPSSSVTKTLLMSNMGKKSIRAIVEKKLGNKSNLLIKTILDDVLDKKKNFKNPEEIFQYVRSEAIEKVLPTVIAAFVAKKQLSGNMSSE